MHHYLLSPLIVLLLATTAWAWETITLATADSQDSTATKITNLLLTECFHRLDYRVDILRRPSKRSIVEADDGRVDGEFARTEAVAARYPNLIKVPEHIGQETLSAFTAYPDMKVEGWASLVDRHVAWVAGREICSCRLGHVARKTLEKNEESLLRFLGAQRAEAGVMGRERGREMLKRLGVDNVHPVEPPLEVVNLYLYLHKRHKPIIPGVVAMLRKLKSDGTLEAIRRHFHEGAPYPRRLLSNARP